MPRPRFTPLPGTLPALALAALVALPGLNGCTPAVVATGTAVGASVVHDRRTTGTVIDDSTLALKVRSALNDDPGLRERGHVNVTTYNGVVLLTGEVPDATLRARAGSLAENAGAVRIVHNELVLEGPSSAMTRASDALLQAKIKTRMLTTKDFDPTRVKVTVEQGTAYLMGLVTRREAALATEISRRVSGVQKVVRVFEYIQADAGDRD